MTVWIYARKSIAQADDRLSIQAQEQNCRNYATFHKLTPGPDPEGVLTKDGQPFSAVVLENNVRSKVPLQRRPLGGIMYRLLAPGDHIITWKFDRLFRSVGEFYNEWKMFAGKGVTLHLVSQFGELSDKNPTAKAMVGMLAVFAEWEKDLIAERTREALGELRREGKRSGGHCGLGNKYVLCGGNGVTEKHWRVVPDLKEIALMGWMLDCHEKCGFSVRQIAVELNKRGLLRQVLKAKKNAVRDKRGRVARAEDFHFVPVEWTHTTVGQALRKAKAIRLAKEQASPPPDEEGEAA